MHLRTTSPFRSRSVALLTVAVTVLPTLGACGSEATIDTPTSGSGAPTSTPIDPGTVVLRYALWGGCDMAGPNCPVYTVHADGTVEVGRNTGGPTFDPALVLPVEATGRVPADELAAFLTLADGADPSRLLDELGPGECASCVDGADIAVVVHPGTADELRLESTVVKFDPAHPLFAALSALATDLADAAPLTVIWPEQTVTS